MPYAFTLDVPATQDFYGDVAAKLKTETPAGLIAHIVHARPDGGLRYTDVWESQADWEMFNEKRVMPAIAEVAAAHGITVDRTQTVFTEIEVIDAWV
jgi:hypothetical protein